MARMPDLTALGQRPTPDPQMGVVGVRGATGAETAMGEAVAQVGRQLGASSKEWAHDLKVEKDKADRIRAEDAFNKLEEARRVLTHDEKEGFSSRRGSAASNGNITGEYTKRFEEAQKAIADSLPDEEQKRLFQLRANVSRRAFLNGLQTHVVSEERNYRKQVFEASIDVATRSATSSWQNAPDVQAQLVRIENIITEQGKEQGWAPEVVQSLKQQQASKVHSAVIGQALAAEQTTYAKNWFEKFKDQIDPATAKALYKQVEDETQKTLFNGYQRVFIDNNNDRRTLAALERTVNADTKLDEGRKNILLGRIQSKVETLDRRAEMAQMRWERGVERQINAVNAITLQGFEPSAEQMAPLVAATKGTAFEPQVRAMVATANATRQFRLASPQQQERFLTDLETQARQDPTRADLTMMTRLRSIYEAQQKAVRDDPISFAVRQGQVDPGDTAARPLDLSKPETLGPQLAERATLARSLSSRYGSPLKVLTKEESDALVGALKNASAADRSKYIGSLSRALADDPQAYKAVMAQIAPDSPTTAIAGAYAANNFRDPKGKMVSDLILRGQDILQPKRKEDGSPDRGKLWPMPSDTDLRKAFQSYERDAFAGLPQARSDYYQAAQAIYAAKSADAGDSTGVLDSKRWEESIKLATGGVERWNGKATVMPYGMTRGEFRDGLKLRIDALAASGNIDPAVTSGKLWDMPIEIIGDGRYVFRAGDGVMVGNDGRPLVVDFNQAPPLKLPTQPAAMGETPAGAVTGRAGTSFGPRQDGTQKGEGYFGVLKRPDGNVSTELSVGVEINGKEVEVPAIVPTLTKNELDRLLSLKESDRIPDSIMDKAVSHARKRIAAGKSPFAEPGEKQRPPR